MVKKWRFSIFALTIIVLYTGWNWPSASPENVNVHPLVQTFQTDELRTDTWMIHHGASLDRPLSEKRLRRLIQSFRLKEETPFQVTPNIKHSERIYTAEWRRNIFLEIRVIRRGHEKSGQHDADQHYLLIKMEAHRGGIQPYRSDRNAAVNGRDAQQDVHWHPNAPLPYAPLPLLEDAVQTVSEGLTQIGIHPDIHVSIQGTTARPWSRSEQQSFIHHVLEGMDAHEVEAMRDRFSTSVSAFSPQLGKPVQSNGQNINVQMAVRNDQVTNRTVITLGTPIITIEY